MASSSTGPTVLASTALVLFLLLCLGPSAISGNNKLRLMLQRLEAPAPKKTDLAVEESKGKNFPGSLKRQRWQLWDPTWSNTQQWDPQWDPQWNPELPHMGFNEEKFEDDVTYWLNRDRNGHDYYDYHRHYDEDAAIGPRSPDSFRHGASVHYDDY